MGSWDVVYREDDMNVIISTQVFKLKQFPDVLIKNFKSVLCSRGDMKLEGIYIFETYAPVVQYTDFRLMFIIEILLQLESKHCYITDAFIRAKLEENEKLSVKVLRI